MQSLEGDESSFWQQLGGKKEMGKLRVGDTENHLTVFL